MIKQGLFLDFQYMYLSSIQFVTSLFSFMTWYKCKLGQQLLQNPDSGHLIIRKVVLFHIAILEFFFLENLVCSNREVKFYHAIANHRLERFHVAWWARLSMKKMTNLYNQSFITAFYFVQSPRFLLHNIFMSWLLWKLSMLKLSCPHWH